MRRARIVGIALALVFLALAFWKTDINEVIRILSSTDYRLVVAAAGITLVGYIGRTYRWKWILSSTKDISTSRLFPILMIGFMANNVLPMRMGEFVRAHTLQRREEISKSYGLATIFLERLLDGLTLVSFLAALSLSFPLPGWGMEAAYAASVIFIGAAVLIAAILLREDVALVLLRLITRPFSESIGDWALRKTTFFIQGLRAIQRVRLAMLIALLSLAIWTFEAASYYVIINAFGVPLSPPKLVTAAFLLLVMVNLGTMLPSAPGYVGTFQAFGVLALSAFNVQREIALSIAIVSHTMQYVLVTAIGLFFFWRQNLPLRKISRDAVELP